MLLTIDDVLSLVPVSRPTLYKLMRDDTSPIPFPKSVAVGGRVMWSCQEVEDWIEKLKVKRDGVKV